MKILVVSHYYPPHVGGLELVALYQAKFLTEKGHSVTVVTSRVSAEEREEMLEGVEVVRVRALNLLEKKWGIPFPLFSPRLLLVLWRETKKAEVVHIHDAFYISSFTAALCARLQKKPVILMQHVEMVNHPSALVMLAQKIVYATSGAYVFKASAKILTLNDRVEQFLLKKGISSSKLVQFVNGVDAELFHPANREQKKKLRAKLHLAQNKKVVLFVGRFVPKKGFHKLLAIQNDTYQFVFCGGTKPPSAPKNAVFLGTMPHEDTAQVYQAANIFVLPSEGEGFPLSVQEAMASGLPVITTNDIGYKRYGFDINCVCLIDNPTSSSVEKAIDEILNDERRMEAMSRYSREYALAHFSWPIVINALEALYERQYRHN
ncbi:MAG: glycosyltransferase family 4 protein [Candidatus Adlerbacteria bacterium]|nr:glycosyltransferase family 4 protein [Candidatus Adlerbacteria bacterium]